VGLDDTISCGTFPFIKVDRTEGAHAAALQAAVSALNLAPGSERVAQLSAALSAFQKQSFNPVRKAEFDAQEAARKKQSLNNSKENNQTITTNIDRNSNVPLATATVEGSFAWAV
jgi:hypothetical protein